MRVHSAWAIRTLHEPDRIVRVDAGPADRAADLGAFSQHAPRSSKALVCEMRRPPHRPVAEGLDCHGGLSWFNTGKARQRRSEEPNSSEK